MREKPGNQRVSKVKDKEPQGVYTGVRQGVWTHARGYVTGHSWKFYIGVVAVILGLVMLMLPSPYVVETPGPTQDVLGRAGKTQVISISGIKTYEKPGKLLLVTVNAQGVPGYPVPNALALLGWADSQMEVLPQEAVFPVGQSAEEYEKSSTEKMDKSQDSAATAALEFAHEHLGVDVAGAKVKMHVEDIGGPSAGMMYALGVIDLLTPDNETGGKTIAGTGTIDNNGKVGAIGGIQLKMLGAKRDGASWFLAPAANCDEVVGHVPSGMRDVRVSTLEEAYNAMVKIGAGEGASLPQCSVNGVKR